MVYTKGRPTAYEEAGARRTLSFGLEPPSPQMTTAARNNWCPLANLLILSSPWCPPRTFCILDSVYSVCCILDSGELLAAVSFRDFVHCLLCGHDTGSVALGQLYGSRTYGFLLFSGICSLTSRPNSGSCTGLPCKLPIFCNVPVRSQLSRV